jgi:hypothetical protein
MADTPKKSNITNEFNVAVTGLNLDNSQNNIKKGSLSYALNAALENHDANSVQYQNEPGNELCFDFPEGYKLIGKHFIPEQNKIIFFITNPETNDSEIGYMENNDCNYVTLVNDSCLNFDMSHPVLRMVHRVTNFGTEIYWADNNGRRYLDIDNIPWIPAGSSEICNIKDSSKLDCNKLLLQPEVNIPVIDIDETVSGGEIISGTYQFTVQYADVSGNPYTSYYGVTNPLAIGDVNITTPNFNYIVGQSIVVNVQNLNPLGQYQYFNLTVIKTINGISTPELIGTYFIDDVFKKVTYTGQIQTNIQLSMNDVFEKFTYYDNADYVTAVQDVLVWKGMTAVERLSYQKIANQIKLQWQSYRIPASENYATGTNSSKFRGYLRDEVYAFEVVFLLSNGKETDGFHIPGRIKGQLELTASPVDQSNPDFIGTPDENTTTTAYWKVYNTATVKETNPAYDPTDDEFKGKYQSGEFAYWESTEEYPCDKEMWGELAGEKIRHHKFPDVLVSPIIESSVKEEDVLHVEDVAIFPLGVKIDSNAVERIIGRSDLTEKQKSEIVGYKITRADRGVNKSIIAKGMLRNVGKYEKDDQTFLYPNYPYNDVKEDKFLNSSNNAWSQISSPYVVDVLEFNNPEEDPSSMVVEYKDHETNKFTTITYNTLGKQDPICSIGKPTILGVGVKNKLKWSRPNWVPINDCIGTVGDLEYDVWNVYVGKNGLGVWYAGYTLEWEDPIEGTKSMWMSGADNINVNVVKGTTPLNTSDGKAGNNHVFVQIDSIRSEYSCTTELTLDPFKDDTLKSRQIFNSPETSFGQPFLGNILKLESVMYGAGRAHFVEVKDNAKYKLLTEHAQRDALLAAEKVADITNDFSIEAMFSVYNSYVTTYINGITRRNYAYSFNSTASYNFTEAVPNNFGVKQRNLDIKKYITPDVLSVGEDEGININNYNRETSVYLRTLDTPLPFPHDSVNMSVKNIEDDSRFTISDVANCEKPQKEEDISVVSYYGSLKNEFVNQYGQINSYDSVDTGFVKIFGKEDLSEDVIFGGDTFIGRFAYKTKVPFFFDNRVNAPDDSDIYYDEIGNIAYPKYWHSSRSILKTYQGTREGLTLTNFIAYKAHNFDCPNDQGPLTLDADDDPENYPDRTYYDGYFYTYAYGVPSFYCESSYNLDLRTAFNNKEGDFWPHVSTGIPDDWVQETNVSILNDNTYNYNTTFSKQNRESVITHLPADWGSGENRTKYPFRAVYSDKQITDADNRINNWLIYRPISYFDFPQNYGELTALDGLKDSAILARFENKSLLYNSLLTIDTSNPQAAYVGNDKLFSSAPPIDFAETDQGYVGSQHKMLLKTPYGVISVDAKRGQIFLINGAQLQDLSLFNTGMHRWFTAHLPFEITKYFPEVNTDNHFNGVGLHGVFDSNHERVLITKIDYIPLNSDITFENNKFYLTEGEIKKEIYLEDSDHFCNVSWTLSFNFNTNTWISFHSYIPNWYVGENNFFYSGMNQCPNDFDALVGVLDTVVPTTTSTTTVPPTTTTTTTIPEFIPDCTFDAIAETPACDLEGSGVFVGEPITPPCTRPDYVDRDIKLITGYTLVTPVADIDSTGSSGDACANLSYYVIYGAQDTNYTPKVILGDIDSGYTLGSFVYDSATYPDCSVVPDGWYFTDETSADNQVFFVINGKIDAIIECGIENTTTTTTTTVLPTYAICYTGLYEDPDPVHPLGGVVEYIDEFGDAQIVDGIWNTDTINLTVHSIISATGVTLCTP